MNVPIKIPKCKILIPGGAGFVGRNLIRVLHSEKYDMNEVTVLDNDKSNLAFVERYGVQTQCVDLAEKREWCDEFSGWVRCRVKEDAGMVYSVLDRYSS